ncbi:response regulator [Leptothoe spongobia]|uniref:Response regulator n=1 Tax=Leptothoe spongobia TAU-MAC 1115 TaxID=1967444 RepID=A0A947DHP0_9CYAN|nr:response regulator [Leptothoe spongobia]MBT9317362.1 response regulator [Leptothoe spongobia TAU-MAC 1115]
MDLLLVEDNAADAFLIKAFLQNSQLPNTLYQVQDGEAAMAFLRQEADYAGVPRPNLILLDLNLPKKDGCEVLEELKADPHLQGIPVIVMTGSSATQDILRSYELHASCYVTKPSDLDEFNRTMKSLENFWFNYVKLPTNFVRD